MPTQTLVISYADIEGMSHGSLSSRTRVEVDVSYTGEVSLTDGRVVPRAIKRRLLPVDGSVEFEVYASDSPDVLSEYHGFGIQVRAVGEAGHGRRRDWSSTRTVKVLTADGDPVEFGLLAPAENVASAGYASVSEVVTAAQQAAADEFDSRLNALESSQGNGIEYVSGVVTPDESVAVHEYFTTGAATIDGVDYEAEQAVVLFRIGGTWVHRQVDLPSPPPPPKVTLLGSYEETDTTAKKAYTFAEAATVPRDGLLVACVYAHGGVSGVTVGGVSLTQIVPPATWDNPSPRTYSVPVTAGAALDISATLSYPRTWFGVDLLLLENVEATPYTVLQPGPGSSSPLVPAGPVGSLVLCHGGVRGPTPPEMGWITPPMSVLTSRVITGGYPASDPRYGNDVRASSAWGLHEGAAFQPKTHSTESMAVAIFKAVGEP